MNKLLGPKYGMRPSRSLLARTNAAAEALDTRGLMLDRHGGSEEGLHSAPAGAPSGDGREMVGRWSGDGRALPEGLIGRQHMGM